MMGDLVQLDKSGRAMGISRSGLKERGVATIELAICFPFFLIFALMAFEAGNYVNDYLRLTRTVYEGARYGASKPQVKEGTCAWTTSAPCGDPSHQDIVNRTLLLLDRAGFPSSISDVSIIVDPTTGAVPPMLTVTVETLYDSVFGGFFGIQNVPLRVNITGPYLFEPLP
ncbi:MAG: pilus assembly protein [bacterium]|nr:pilus assembly protein [bacterium]